MTEIGKDTALHILHKIPPLPPLTLCQLHDF